MGIGRYPDAAITALGAQLIALAAAGFVVEGFHRLRQAAFIVAAVVYHGGPIVRPIREIGALNEISPASLHLIEIEVTRDRVDRPFGDVGALRAAITTIGVNRHGIGDDHAGARFVV